MSDNFTYYCTSGTPEHQRLEQPDDNFPTPEMVELGLNPEICLDCQPATAAEARDLAIDWQQWQSERSLYMSEVADWQAFFERLGRKFNLTDEFKENAII